MPVEVPEFPANACAYERYDPYRLRPTNDSTFIRLMELGWTRADFEGKTVLDIGANSGLLSIYAAHRLGAKHVHATDVQPPLVDFLAAVVKLHSLPITVEKRAFSDLDPATHAADCVLFMEVLHWIVDQGGNVSDAIARIAGLTRETLYFETPWDIKEPSIALRGVVNEEQYNIELILRELSRYFVDVRIQRFMTYFGAMANSKRVLIKATGRRSLGLAAPGLREANLLDIHLKRTSTAVTLVTTPQGVRVLKKLPSDCTLALLPAEDAETLCKFLADLKDPTIVAPLRVGKHYRFAGEDSNRYMLLPFVGKLGDYFSSEPGPKPVTDPVAAAIGLRHDFRQAPAGLVAMVRSRTAPVEVVAFDTMAGDLADRVKRSAGAELCRGASERMKVFDRKLEDALTHTDVQGGNMLNDTAGRPRVVDIDWIRTGTPYSDLLSCALFSGIDLARLEAGVAQLEASEERPLRQLDIDFAVAHALVWVDLIGKQGILLPEVQVGDFLRGMNSIVGLSARVSAG